jgi:imidazolonepropionase-like amidohydrolase
LLRDVIVEIQDGRIAAISNGSANPKPMQTIDGNGLYLVPGLIDSHVHTDNLPAWGRRKKSDMTLCVPCVNRNREAIYTMASPL